MRNWLRRLFGTAQPPAPVPAKPPVRPAVRFDAARTGTENTLHWANADALSPDAAANAADRKILRERARYEVANNCFAFGAANSFAEDVVGTGPRLQLLGLPDEAARAVESAWQAWADEVRLADTLRLMVRAGVVDGESFALTTENSELRHPVQLDFRAFECDRVTDPTLLVSASLVDGIEYDRWGNPARYTVLRQHPGDTGGGGVFGPLEFDTYPAEQVYHWYRADRPGQSRGVSWLTPALPLFSVLRRYTYAVLGSAELAANIAGMLKSDLPPGEETSAPEITAMQEVEIPRGALLTLPPAWDVTQLKAEQPTQQFGDFRANILVEIARVLNMPLNRITGNSSGYNYSSGRLDHLTYHAGGWRLRQTLKVWGLDRLFRAWLDEAALVGVLPDGLPPFDQWAWDWQWDAFGDIDPLKESQASEKLLALNLTDLAEQCAARGRRWDDVLRQRAREKALMDELGLTPAAPAPAQAGSAPVPEDEEEPADA